MSKKLNNLCVMLLATSFFHIKNLNSTSYSVGVSSDGAKSLKAQFPVKVVIDQRNPQNPQAQFLGINDRVPSGLKWIGLPQLAVAYDPENPNEPCVLIDIKKAILKLVVNSPELAQRAGITEKDFANAGITEQELAELQTEDLSDDEVSNAIKFVMNTLTCGSTGDGAMYILDGGGDLMKACGKMSLGSVILMKKAIGGVYSLAKGLWV